jgi:hypothetical protein
MLKEISDVYDTVCQFLDAKGGCVGFGLPARNAAVHTWATVYPFLNPVHRIVRIHYCRSRCGTARLALDSRLINVHRFP